MADISKVNSYVVMGGFDDRVTLTKLVAYVVMNDADTHMSTSKLVAYVVGVESTANAARPQVFVCT